MSSSSHHLFQRLAALASPEKTRRSQSLGFFAMIRRLLLPSPRLLFDSLKILLPTAIFFVKFLEWWYSPGSPARSLSTIPQVPTVPPPPLLPPHPNGISFNPTEYGNCPICHEPFKNATVLPSGYVFCYRCAYDHVERHGRCPVTLMSSRVWQLRKVLA